MDKIGGILSKYYNKIVDATKQNMTTLVSVLSREILISPSIEFLIIWSKL